LLLILLPLWFSSQAVAWWPGGVRGSATLASLDG
jgi:hypothetical protein